MPTPESWSPQMDGKRLLKETFISPTQVAERLGVSKMTVYRMLDRDELEYIRAGRTIRITLSSLIRWLNEGGTAEGDDIAWDTNRRLKLA